MHLIRRPHYQSDTTQFIEQLKANQPALQDGQQQGRALLWDKEVDSALWQDLHAGRVAQKAYVYYAFKNPNKNTAPAQ